MKKLGIAILIILGLIIGFVGLVVGGYKLAYPSYDWHQKLTIEIETPDGIISGSSVTAIEWQKNIFSGGWGGPNWHAKIEGEAVVVDLSNGKYLFALLSYGGHSDHIADLATLSYYDVPERKRDADAFRTIEDINKTMIITEKHYPMLVTFTDINDPKTIKRVDPNNFTASFGEGYKLRNISLEVIDKPVTRGRVLDALKWIYTAEGLIPQEYQPQYAMDQTVEQKLRLSDFIDGKYLFGTRPKGEK